VHLKGTPQRKGAAQGPSIPEGLRVPRDDASAAAVKKQMLEALKPTQGMMQAVMGNAQLMQARGARLQRLQRQRQRQQRCGGGSAVALTPPHPFDVRAKGFDDPDVMAAVSEIADNPAACVSSALRLLTACTHAACSAPRF
jgi:hypothetical protein